MIHGQYVSTLSQRALPIFFNNINGVYGKKVGYSQLKYKRHYHGYWQALSRYLSQQLAGVAAKARNNDMDDDDDDDEMCVTEVTRAKSTQEIFCFCFIDQPYSRNQMAVFVYGNLAVQSSFNSEHRHTSLTFILSFFSSRRFKQFSADVMAREMAGAGDGSKVCMACHIAWGSVFFWFIFCRFPCKF
jgi:hypothetical protein